MKYIFLIISASILTSGLLQAQNFKPASISLSYFGESITHPGVKLAANYELKSWDKSKTWKTGKQKNIQSTISISPGLGFFYHKDYQASLFFIPEGGYTRKKANGNFVTYGLGAGYMRTFIPGVYDTGSDGEIKQTTGGYNYFVTNYSIAFGREINVKHVPIAIYAKPQLMYATPSTPNGVWYFALEMGVQYRL